MLRSHGNSGSLESHGAAERAQWAQTLNPEPTMPHEGVGFPCVGQAPTHRLGDACRLGQPRRKPYGIHTSWAARRESWRALAWAISLLVHPTPDPSPSRGGEPLRLCLPLTTPVACAGLQP